VMPRPEGMRCLLVTSRGRTVSWLRNGAPLHRFHSQLPGGSPASAAAGSGGSATASACSSPADYCILDCIFHPPNGTYYVQDLLCWRGYALYDTVAEFRNYWLVSKFQEEGLMQPRGEKTPDIGVPLPVRPCTLQGLRTAYGRLDFVRDGLYFLHRHGHYRPGPGTTPLALLWKDLGCSRYLLDTDSTGQPLQHQAVTLSYRADRTVATEDDPPVVLGRLPEAFVAAMGDKLKPGRLLRFSIRQGGITFHEGRPAGADLHYEGPANQRRGRADSFSKILFQRLARTAPITASMLAAAV
ncbi:hypothetical protein VOLCADRAFT_42782, partial [Volvox carteri f. nagariensis]